MCKNFRKTLNNRLKDSDFKKEYVSLEQEYQQINAILDASKEPNLTQTQLSEIKDAAQGNISKI